MGAKVTALRKMLEDMDQQLKEKDAELARREEVMQTPPRAPAPRTASQGRTSLHQIQPSPHSKQKGRRRVRWSFDNEQPAPADAKQFVDSMILQVHAALSDEFGLETCQDAMASYYGAKQQSTLHLMKQRELRRRSGKGR